MTDVTEGRPIQMTHAGYGPQIGRDNFGPITYEMMDARLKALVEKFAATAPDLAKAIENTARDGIMSPEAIDVLDRVADHINWDIATILRSVGEHINWDVAELLLSASKGINGDVAREFAQAQRELSNTKEEIDHSLASFRNTVGELKHLQAVMKPIHYEPEGTAELVVTAGRRDGLKSRLKLFCLSCGLGLLGSSLLTSYHQAVWIVPLGVLGCVIAVAPWIGRMLGRG
ncbi:MAG TPA: hypothetical protein VHZ33_07140 [Trebonia sp.]|nr:hypothetical protein [Trebonia sp.]